MKKDLQKEPLPGEMFSEEGVEGLLTSVTAIKRIWNALTAEQQQQAKGFIGDFSLYELKDLNALLCIANTMAFDFFMLLKSVLHGTGEFKEYMEQHNKPQ